MILRFIAKNFLSISEELEFNMFPYNKLRTHQNHILKTDKVDLLKIGALYGANGSGKSNVMKAIHYLHNIVVESEINHPEYVTTHFKLDNKYKDLPTELEIDFKYEEMYFSYGVRILKREILEEWLYELNIENKEDKLIFNRIKKSDNNIELKVTPDYTKTEKDKVLIEVYAEEILDHKQSFLNLVYEKKQFPEIANAFKWFRNKLYIIYPSSRYADLVSKIIDNEKFRNFTNEIISKLDTGISRVDVEKIPLNIYFGDDDKETKESIKAQFSTGIERVIFQASEHQVAVVSSEDGKLYVNKIITKHICNNNELRSFQLDEESDGTRRLFDLLPAIEILINEDSVFFIDEIGRSLHPSLLREFIIFFLERETKGQLIFTTHESYLLDLKIFRQDEIWFVEKEKGSTKIYPLSEFKPRYDLDIRKGYLNGRFGAVPFLGNLSDLNWNYATEEQSV